MKYLFYLALLSFASSACALEDALLEEEIELAPLFDDIEIEDEIEEQKGELFPGESREELANPLIKEELPPPTVINDLSQTCPLSLANVIGSTLQYQWQIHIADAAVLRQEGVHIETKGPFDYFFDSFYRHEELRHQQNIGNKTKIDGYRERLNAAIAKSSRSGTVYSFGSDLAREKNVLNNLPLTPVSTALLFFDIEQPLLRRFLWSVDRGAEMSSYLDLRATKWELIQTMSREVRDSVQSYWQAKFSQEVMNIRRDTEKRFLTLAKGTSRMVEENRLGGFELNQQFAEIFRTKRDRHNSEQVLYQSFNSLLLQMGQDPHTFCPQIPLLELEEYPEITSEEVNWNVDSLMCLAMQNRGDLIAANLRARAAEVLVKTSKNNTLPDLNFRTRISYNNHGSGAGTNTLFTPFETANPELDYLAEINFSYPFGNHGAKGFFYQRIAERDQALQFEAELIATTRSAISAAVRNHYSLLQQLFDAEQSVKWFEEASENEVKRFIEGYGSIFVVIDFEDRLEDARIILENVRRDYASNIADLLFLTGMLLEPDPSMCRAYIKDVRSVSPLL